MKRWLKQVFHHLRESLTPWWLFGQTWEEDRPHMLLVLPDDPEVTIENYQAGCAWFMDPHTGAEADVCYFRPTSFPPDTPWIRESEAKRILQRFVIRHGQEEQSGQ